jgi:quinol monooxygenase YgiN
MKSTRRVILAAMLALGAGAGAAVAAQGQAPQAPPPGPAYVLTYLEFGPSSVNNAIAAMKTYRDASRREMGARTVDIYQEAGHPNRFVLREIWDDRPAYDRHAMAASSSQFTAAVRPIHFGPIYISVHIEYWMSPVKQGGANDTFVITHVDVGGMNVPRLKEMLDKVGPASVNDAGLVRYEILDEVPAHPNHFRFFEQWTSEANWAAHHSSPHARAFRDSVTPILGTPYDQRLYRLVN